jgi:nucleoside-diphosphate-sugar epimerase
MNKVLVTGGSGFVGYWMRRTQPSIEAYFFTKKMYEDYEWEKMGFGAIVHLAPISPERVLKTNTRVLFASSGAVYAGTDEYASNKRHWEYMCNSGDTVIARLFSFVGNRLTRHAVYEFIQQAYRGTIFIDGDGKATRSYLYGEDLGNWMWRLLFKGEGIYDVGSSVPYTILETAKVVSELIPCKIRVMNDPKVPSTYYMPDMQKVRELGCVETVGLKEAIKRTI